MVVLARFRRPACVTDAKRTIRTEPDVANPVSPPAPAAGARGRDVAARGDGRGGARRKLWGTGPLWGSGHRSPLVPDPVGKVEVHAFGVDPTDNSVYVGHEPTKGEYRIQKLSATGQFLASVSFKPANPIGLEGIAVDPAKERVYVLADTLVFMNGGCILGRILAGESAYRAYYTNQSRPTPTSGATSRCAA